MREWLHHRLPERVDIAGMLADERFVYDSGRPVRGGDPYLPHLFVWFHRDLPDEVEVPGRVHVVHRDERLVVVDKPAFLSTIPRGQHIRQSVTVRMREELGLPELSPLHRLDRVTSGLLLLATERRWRGAYQSMFVHLIAGPIIRYDWVKRELQSRPFDWSTFSLGARRFMIGMSMKVLIGDTLAPIVDVAFATSNPSFLDAWIGCLAYSLQLFFDFAG